VNDFVLAVHGGAGALSEDPTYREAVRAGLLDALETGRAVLAQGDGALEAVVAAVACLEACGVLNAGRGGVLNELGDIELDASVMEGTARRAGAVAGVSHLAHPVSAARALLEEGRHVLVFGESAEAWALDQGCAAASPSELITPFREAQLARVLSQRERPEGGGTVGAVARDREGRLAAATSTGGTVGKRSGRISDSAIIGAGTWADDLTCAVSATGEGEYFIRSGFARSVDMRLRHTELALDAACAEALAEVLELGGSGGCIALDPRGGFSLRCNTAAMARGMLRGSAPVELAIDADEALRPVG
jgi:beta-aspartyl-peptidase (threonine type)